MQMANSQEDWATITALWSSAEEHGIRDNDVFFYAARALERLGRVGEAEALLLEAIALEDVKADTMLALARLYWENGDQEAGDALAERVKQQFPGEGHPYFFHANFLFRHGRYVESLPLFEEALAHGYENALVWERIGIARYRANEFDAADIALQRASELQASEAARGRPVGHTRAIQLLLYQGATLWELQQISEASLYACEAVRRSGYPQQLPPLPPELVNLCTEQQ
jgi:tetratricopeptide (TPR) repeat protein